jgi:hypothetical protein
MRGASYSTWARPTVRAPWPTQADGARSGVLRFCSDARSSRHPSRDPVRDGDGLGRLRSLLNAEEREFRLIVGWLVAALIPDMPHPIMALRGEQGSAKSSTAQMLANLIDPSPAPLRSVPRDIKQWAVTASASWAVALDNVSAVPGWLSDTLCKAVTGDGYVDRVLYSDDDVTVLAFRRVILMTSIDPGALAGDLAERLLVIELKPISDGPTQRSGPPTPTAGPRSSAACSTSWSWSWPRCLACRWTGCLAWPTSPVC